MQYHLQTHLKTNGTKKIQCLFNWTIISPILGWLLYFSGFDRSKQFCSGHGWLIFGVQGSFWLTIPTVTLVCHLFELELVLGLDAKSMILLGLSVFIVMLSLSKGKTNMLYGVVLLVNLMAYIFTIIFP